MSTKELAITKKYDLAKPAEVVAMANVLKDYVVNQSLYTNIKGKNYAHVDGWQFAGFLSGLNAIVEDVKDLSTDKEIKWSAFVKLYQGDKVIGTGYALCSNKEAIKKSFDEYAILSMAQTRAIGKAFRNKIGWIMKLAGYESTPSEEMTKVGQDSTSSPKTPQKSESDESLLVDAREALFELARDYGAKHGNEKQFIVSAVGKKIAWSNLTIKHYGMLAITLKAKYTK